MTKRYAVDRIEENIAVLVPDEGKKVLNLPLSDYPLQANDVVDVTFGLFGKITAVTSVPGEKEAREKKNADLLHALFERGKKQ